LDFEIWIFLNYLWPDFDVALSGSPIIPFAFSKNFFEGSKYFTGNKEKVSLIKSISSFSFSAVKL